MTFDRFWDKEKDAAMRALAAQGVPVIAIQAALGAVSPQAVRNHGKRIGVSFARGPVIRGDAWNAAQETVLRDLAAKGNSASDISKALGGEFSRNAVLGKAMRMGVQLQGLRWDPSRTRAGARKPSKPRVKRISAVERVALIVEMAAVEGITLDELTDKVCNFPVTDDVPFKFCGKDKKRGRYCEAHWSIAHQHTTLARL